MKLLFKWHVHIDVISWRILGEQEQIDVISWRILGEQEQIEWGDTDMINLPEVEVQDNIPPLGRFQPKQSILSTFLPITGRPRQIGGRLSLVS
jgi:hypothetical protein